MPDKYDREIRRLSACSQSILSSWSSCGLLFDLVAPPGVVLVANDNRLVGCLVQIRNGTHDAWTKELTKAIRADGRIPKRPEKITVDDLPVFAEWQRRIDKELGRDAIGKGEA